MLIVLAAYAVIWTLYGVLAKAIQDVQSDAAELVAWSHHLELGYAKHPPFAAWLMRTWFTLFPIQGLVRAICWPWPTRRSGYGSPGACSGAFSIPTSASSRWPASRWCRTSIFTACASTTTPCSARSGRRPRCASSARSRRGARLGGACRRGRGGRHARQILVDLPARGSCGGGARRRRGARAISARPRLGSRLRVGALLLAPHFIWLVQYDFLPLTYAVGAHGAKTLSQSCSSPRAVISPAAPAMRRCRCWWCWHSTRPSGAALADTLLPGTPERRFVAVAFWATLLLPAACRAAVRRRSQFDMDHAGLSFLCRWFCCPRRCSSLSRQAVIRDHGVRCRAAAGDAGARRRLIAIAIHLSWRRIPSMAHAKLLAGAVEQEWRRTSDRAAAHRWRRFRIGERDGVLSAGAGVARIRCWSRKPRPG